MGNASLTVCRSHKMFGGAVVCLAALAASWSGPIQAAEYVNHPFPRLASMQIGKKNYADPARQSDMAKMDLLVMGFYEGWTSDGQSIRDAVRSLKNKSPNMVVLQYTNINEVYNSTIATAEIRNKVESSVGPNGRGDWYARDASGNLTGSWPGTNTLNMTSNVTPDQTGMRLPEWYAGYVKRKYFDPVPEFDGIYIDVFRSQPLVKADWNGDGANDDPKAEQTVRWYTEGQRAYRDALRRLYPSHPVVVNATSWNQEAIPSAYKGVLEGGFMEHAMGMSWSIEGTAADGTVNSWGSWDKMMTAYRKLMADTVEPHLVMLDVRGRVTDYKLMRYGLTSTLMHDGYFSFTDDANVYSSVPLFDEYAVDLGGAIDPPQGAAWSNGVYRRNFTNGTVLVNPRGNGARAVRVEAGFKRFRGNQDPLHNNGSSVSSMTLDEGDGIVLIRAANRPSAPSLFGVE